MIKRFLGVLLLAPVCAMAEVSATVLWYVEQETGTGPYKVRYIVSEDFIRSDNGNDNGDFMLYERRNHRISSVTREEHRVLQIDGAGSVPAVPDGLEMEVRQSVDREAPTIAGKRPLKVQLMAGDQLCYMATVLPGLLPDAREALLEFNRALAVQQVRLIDNTPEEFRTPCFLLRYLYATDFFLVHGLPLLDLDGQGDRRELVDYESGVKFDDSLFVVPDDYEVQELGGTAG